MPHAHLLLSVLLVATLAGCAGGAKVGPEPLDDLVVTRDTGILRGFTLTPAIVPVQNVAVTVVGPTGNVTETVTNADGAFGLDLLPPGAYAVKASKPGYATVQATTVVVAGVANPEPLKLTMATDLTTMPYHQLIVFDGYIECTTSAIVLCGAPNLATGWLCDGTLGPGNICLGNVTGDRYTPTLFYDPNITYLQAELVWDSTQALSPELHLQVEAGDDVSRLGDVEGESPLKIGFNETQLAADGIGGEVGVYYSIFSSSAVPVPTPVGDLGPGVTLQQKVRLFTTSFYRYTPPADWSFAEGGSVPAPPA